MISSTLRKSLGGRAINRFLCSSGSASRNPATSYVSSERCGISILAASTASTPCAPSTHSSAMAAQRGRCLLNVAPACRGASLLDAVAAALEPHQPWDSNLKKLGSSGASLKLSWNLLTHLEACWSVGIILNQL